MAKTKAIVAEKSDLETKIESVTKGLTKSYQERLNICNAKHSSVICDYILALGSELKLSEGYKQAIINNLIILSRISTKGFKDFTREDIITYLNRTRKDKSKDPTQKWVSTYNMYLV